MEEFYKKLDVYKTANGLSYKELGGIINKSESAMRMAIKRQSLTLLEQDKLANLFHKKRNQIEEDARIEDLLAEKIMENLLPIINKVLESHQKIIKELIEQGADIDDIKDEIQELKDTCELIGKDVKELH